MLPKDLLVHLEKGNRVKDHLDVTPAVSIKSFLLDQDLNQLNQQISRSQMGLQQSSFSLPGGMFGSFVSPFRRYK